MNKYITLLFLAIPFYGVAQVDWENPKGAIKNEEIVIEKDKQIILRQVSRRFTAITIDPLVIDTSAIRYIPKEIKVQLPKIPVRLRPRTMKTEALNPTYWGSFKLGYGSYVSPYVQADIASKRSEEYAVAAHFRHFSSKNGPVDNSNSGLSNTDAYLSGKLFLNKATLGANLGGRFDTYHLYGYAGATIPETNDIRQRLSTYTANLSIADNDKNEDFYYSLNGGVHLFNAKDQTWKETDLYLNFTANAQVSNLLKVNVDGGLHAANQDKTAVLVKNNRLYYKVKPVAVYTLNDFEFEAGAGLFGVKDSINATPFKTKIYIAPHVVARYKFSSGHIVSGGITGDVKWKSARTEFAKNPYLGVNGVINNDVKPIEIFLKASGRIAPKIDFNIGYNTSVYKVFGQYINNISDQSTFLVNYQTTNNLIHTFSGQLEFITAKNFLLSLYGKYNIFSFDLIEQPFHVPTVDAGLSSKLSLMEKLDLDLVLTYLDGIEAVEPAGTVQLNSIVDLNLSATYKVNSSFSAFIKMQNILGNNYQYYYHYPVKGFQFLGGLAFTL